MEKEYAQALKNALQKGEQADTLVARLTAHLKERGRLKLLPAILRELKVLKAKHSATAPVVEAASKAEADAAKREAKQEGIEVAEVTINPNLISGWRAMSGGTLVDRSGKRALADLYRKIIS